MKDGKIFTPKGIINEMLDGVDFNTKFIGKKILEPSCGDGNFLVEMVSRTLKFSKNKKKDLENIYGWELIQEDVETCKIRLNKLVGDLIIDWKVYCVDSLVQKEKGFDLVIGNPPYIKIQDLSEETRETLKSYSFCQSSSTDIFLAFFELGFNKLNDNGVLCYITPNSFLMTKASIVLREKLKNNFFRIKNFGSLKQFIGVSVYTAISYISKKDVSAIEYILDNKTTTMNTNLLDSSVWNFYMQDNNLTELKELISIKTGIATLADKVFIFNDFEISNDLINVYSRESNSYETFELSMTKEIIKGSKLKSGELVKERVLWVYDNTGNPYKENYIKNNFPKAYKYLLSMRERLAMRDRGNKQYPEWYCFGRSQGLKDSFGEKIFFSPISNKPNFIHNTGDATIYSGYYFKYLGDVEKLLKVLNSKSMEDYINHTGRDFSSGWKSYTKSVVEKFRLDKSLL